MRPTLRSAPRRGIGEIAEWLRENSSAPVAGLRCRQAGRGGVDNAPRRRVVGDGQYAR
jgi:hypothetical protein